jgi:hypothetical protein
LIGLLFALLVVLAPLVLAVVRAELAVLREHVRLDAIEAHSPKGERPS